MLKILTETFAILELYPLKIVFLKIESKKIFLLKKILYAKKFRTIKISINQ